MVIQFKSGKIILTTHEVVVRLGQEVTLQAQADAITLMGNGANVMIANGSETKWSIKLDDETQLRTIAQTLGCDVL
ncbi:DUF3389 domain-containing protein [Vibrio mimicus]|uniref:Phosphotransferase system IIA component n=2 Tax=Vibrio mimicus TaxID=674 RepID=D2YH32_VIBMI|nr:DUF3389 domain-containing protein [Vibrio mimicus]AOW84245.1 PTS sugar transporter subunit IIA [Vibrio mimicus]EEW05978.1 conserved hypothetical protein [Vibrio mimicus VM603]EEW09744.1 conserved hypothetical protein [Vibrio mimicus VM573]EEY45221.1 phosphotransferase system IIA component [Vibrio mimicus VM223]EGU17822.1 hypothetical protein SX4_1397 [Vibrio mimicus SX-4]